MSIPRIITGVVLVGLLIFIVSKPVLAISGLYVREINITGNEFIVLQATTNISNLGQYWLGYINDNLSTAVPSQQLPMGIGLNSGQSILLTSNPMSVCDTSVVAKLSFSGFNNTKGVIALWQQVGPTFNQIENITWNASAAVINPTVEGRITPTATNAVWYNDGTESWTVGDLQGCSLVNVISQSLAPQSVIQWPAGAGPPVTIISLGNESLSISGLPAADVGLAGPQISELLPNPAPPQADSEDEYIELYNPNPANFDLSGFKLEVGTSSLHDYTFAAGTTLPAKGFTAFYSADTGLSMTNNSGQAKLIDPLGNVISQSDVYASAKDGQAWALANGKWVWTSTPTPNAANIINGSPTAGSKSTKSAATPSVKGASTGSANSSGGLVTKAASPAPIHPWTLVGVGAAALLYAGYEYRTDLANRIYKLRRYLEARRTTGKKINRR